MGNLPEGVYRRSKSKHLYIRYTFNGKTYRESAQTADPKKAARFRNERIQQCIGGKGSPVKFEKVTFKELADDMLLDYEINGKRTLKKTQERLRVHIMPIFGRMRAQAVTTEKVKKYTCVDLKKERRTQRSTASWPS